MHCELDGALRALGTTYIGEFLRSVWNRIRTHVHDRTWIDHRQRRRTPIYMSQIDLRYPMLGGGEMRRPGGWEVRQASDLRASGAAAQRQRGAAARQRGGAVSFRP